MLIRINKERLDEAIASIGAHKASIPIFSAKSSILPFKLLQVRTPAANIIKQEMLAVGGDAVIPAGAVVCRERYADVLLLGTVKHYNLLLGKLAQMNYFGMEQIADELRAALSPRTLQTVLADGRILDYAKMRVMGTLNVTPDSFYAGSRVSSFEDVLRRAGVMLEEGADIIDIGGESTRPGSAGIDGEEERRRVLPVIRELRKNFPRAVLSIDTYRARTAEEALAVGADIINDISAMEADAGMARVIAESGAPVVLMHMRGTPENMQQHCDYVNVVEEVATYLSGRAKQLQEKGVADDKIILDPGIGFAKNQQQNLLLMRDLHAFTSFGYPVLLAASRKSTIGSVLGGLPAEERLEGTLAASMHAVYAGAQIVRVHDVKENVRAVRMLEAILCPQSM